MEYAVEEREGVAVLAPRGEIDVSQALVFRDALGTLLDGANSRVLVDLREVRFIDSSGVGILVTAHRKALEVGGAFGLAGPGESVRRTLQLTRTDRLLKVYPSVDDGVEALR